MKTIDEKFLEEIGKIKNLSFFFGVCNVLGVKLVDENKEAIPAEDLFQDLIEKFSNFNRNKKRELLQILKKANKSERTVRAPSSDEGIEDPKENK